MIKDISLARAERICKTYFVKALKDSGLKGFSFSKDCLSKALFEDDEIVSIVIYRKIETGLFEIDFIATRAEFERSGAAGKLLESFGASEIWLELSKKNEKALRFYEKKGFVVTGERLNYYSNGDSALNMVRK